MTSEKTENPGSQNKKSFRFEKKILNLVNRNSVLPATIPPSSPEYNPSPQDNDSTVNATTKTTETTTKTTTTTTTSTSLRLGSPMAVDIPRDSLSVTKNGMALPLTPPGAFNDSYSSSSPKPSFHFADSDSDDEPSHTTEYQIGSSDSSNMPYSSNSKYAAPQNVPKLAIPEGSPVSKSPISSSSLHKSKEPTQTSQLAPNQSSVESDKESDQCGDDKSDPAASQRQTLSPGAALDVKDEEGRSRANTGSSRYSQASSVSQKSNSSTENSLRKSLSKLTFWKSSENNSKTSLSQLQQRPTSTGSDSTDSTKIPADHKRSKSLLAPPFGIQLPRRGSSTSNAEMNTVPFPNKRENSAGSFGDISKLLFESDSRIRRRKTEENDTRPRSRSSSLGLQYAPHIGRSKRSTNSPVQLVSGLSDLGFSTPKERALTGETNSGPTPFSGDGDAPPSGRRAIPPRQIRLVGSLPADDVRFHRVLPLPPPPTIGTGNVMEDPDVKALKLEAMAVRHADHLHMLGYTRNRHVCALLAKESNKDKIKYNEMVMVAFLMRMMNFRGEPLDMSLRKYLYKMVLSQESQQIERQLQSFCILWNYHNPGIFADEDHVLTIVFSLVMLHTATFNKNVRQKMSKSDYVRNSPSEDLAPEIFEYFYDNITATPFKAEDELAPSTPIHMSHPISNSLNSSPFYPWASPSLGNTGSISANGCSDYSNNEDLVPPHIGSLAMFDSPSSQPAFDDSLSSGSRRSPSFIWQRDNAADPYPYVLENRLDSLRSTLPKMGLEPPLTYCAINSKQDLDQICAQLENYCGLSLQITSGRSKTDSQSSQSSQGSVPSRSDDDTVHSSSVTSFERAATLGSRPSVVEIPVVKHGVVLRREYKRTLGVGELKAGWREWGLLLTTSKLYLFKSSSWIRNLSGEHQKVTISLDALHSARTISTRDIAALVKVVPKQPSEESHTSTGDSPIQPQASLPSGGNIRNNFSGTNLTSSNDVSSEAAHTKRAPSARSMSSPNMMFVHNTTPHVATGPNGIGVFDFVLVDGGRDTAQQYFAVSTEEELESWVQSINVIATQTSLKVGLLPNQLASKDQLRQALDDVNEQIDEAEVGVMNYQRTLEHFQMLAPLQQRTREQLVFTVGRYTSKFDDLFADMARLKAYSNILTLMINE